MFCSKCGKTINPQEPNCPHCGAQVGDSRFEGNGYTAAQPVFQSGEGQARDKKAAPYTRTTYTSMTPDEQAGEDVYTRTTYRPVLSDPAQEKPAPEPSEKNERTDEPADAPQAAAPQQADIPDDEKAAPAPEAEPQSPQPAVQSPDGEPAEERFVIEPPKSIHKTGISPEVEEYIRRMNEQKERKKGGRRGPLFGKGARDDQEEAQAQMDGVQAGEAGQEKTADGEEPERGVKRRRDRNGEKTARRGVPGWVKPVVIVACVAVICVVGVYVMAMLVADRSPIDGVSYDLYMDGKELIATHAGDTYRKNILQLYASDSSGTAVAAQQLADNQAIEALMPEEPRENDQLFIDTLLSIQDAINTATMTDYVAAQNASDETLAASLNEESATQWKVIENAITRLDIATTAKELSGIIEGTEITLTTPTPSPTPETVAYKTLKKGMMNSDEVKKLQSRLYKLGWFNGKRDGDFGTVTTTAVKRFQKAAGLEPDGIATSELQELLYSDDAPRNEENSKATATPSPTATPAPTPTPSAEEKQLASAASDLPNEEDWPDGT